MSSFSWNSPAILITIEINAPELNGEPINDAKFNRSKSIESRFSISITEEITFDHNTGRRNTLAGDDTFDIYNNAGTMAITLWKDGLVYTIDKLQYINLDKPYWDKSANEALTIGGVQYIATGALNLSEYDYTSALLFNKKLIADYTLSNPYDFVNDGTWTFDRMLEMMSAIVEDINGDTKMDETDQWGFLSCQRNIIPSFIVASGEKIISKNENDLPYISIGNNRAIDVLDKTFSMMWDSAVWYPDSDGANVPQSAIDIFSADRGLFLELYLAYIPRFRDMDNDFGITPYPKYDENQKSYFSKLGWVQPFTVPITNTDTDRTSIILEAMYSESAKKVIPEYYNKMLKTKVSRDTESSAMFDLIFSSRVLDYGDTVWSGIGRDGKLQPMMINNDKNISSKIPGMEQMLRTEMKSISEIIDIDISYLEKS